MEVVIFVLAVFIIASAIPMFINYYAGRDDKGFPYSRNKKTLSRITHIKIR